MNGEDRIELRTYIERLMAESDKRYMDRFASQDEAVKTAMASAEKAVDKAETATQRRFEAVNEFRQQLNDQATTFMPRAEYSVQHASLEQKVDQNADRLTDLGKLVSNMQGRSAAMMAALGVGLVIFQVVLKFVVK